MKKCLFLCILCCALGIARAQEALLARLDSLVRLPLFETTQVGLMVYDLTADTTLFAYNQRQLLRPASTMKLVTAITALDQLGSDYEYTTRLYYTGDIEGRTLRGDVYCVGGFDPTLTLDDVTALAQTLSQLGIDSICGRLVADQSMKEALDYGEGWCWDDDNPLLQPLSIGRRYNFLEVFAEEVARLGINLEGVQLATGRRPQQARLVGTLSHGIGQVMERMMKMSDNFYAESMFYQTAASARRGVARAVDACNVTRQLIRRLGLGGQPYRIADGSGLSLYNYVSAELLCRLLRHAWQTPHIHETLLPTLPIAGVDGTLEKRMRGTSAYNNVMAKTGTLSGISSLAGYCLSAEGHDLCFAIINQGVMRNADGRDFQDKVCAALCDNYVER